MSVPKCHWAFFLLLAGARRLRKKHIESRSWSRPILNTVQMFRAIPGALGADSEAGFKKIRRRLPPVQDDDDGGDAEASDSTPAGGGAAPASSAAAGSAGAAEGASPTLNGGSTTSMEDEFDAFLDDMDGSGVLDSEVRPVRRSGFS